MLICAGLLVVGAAVSWYGLRERRDAPAVSASRKRGDRTAGSRRLTRSRNRVGRASALSVDAERGAVTRDDHVSGGQDPGTPALERRLVRGERVELGRPVRVPPQVGHDVHAVVRLDDQRSVLLAVAGRQPELALRREPVAVAVVVEPQVVEIARPEVDDLCLREQGAC